VTTTVMSRVSLATVAELAAQLRVDSIRASTSAGSGHPTSGMSAADLVAVLVARHLRVDWDDPTSPGNDHLIFSKGHASPRLYSVFKAVGVVSEDELLGGYRRFGQHLQGHPTPVLPWVDVATRIVSYQDWTRELLALGEQALAEARPLPAAYLFGMAEFFLPAEDPR
jgi:transketolase